MIEPRSRLNGAGRAYVRGILRNRWTRPELPADADEVTRLLRYYQAAGYSNQIIQTQKKASAITLK
jgi:hypothetical protein